MLTGDPNPLRDIGHAKWHDPYAALEDVSGTAFALAVETEAAEFVRKTAPHKSNFASTRTAWKTLIEEALPRDPSAAQETVLWHGYTIYIQHAAGHRKNIWIYSADHLARAFEDLVEFGVDPESNNYFIIKDVGNGDQTLELSVYTIGVHTAQYTLDPVGPAAAFQGPYLYFQSVENQLRYPGLLRVNKENGRGRTKLFEEKDKRYQVELFAPPRQHDLFIRTSNALSQRLGIVKSGGVRWLTPPAPEDGKGATLIPISAMIYATNTHLVAAGRQHPYPKGAFLLDAVHKDADTLLVATVKHAVSSVYLFDLKDRAFKPVLIGIDCNNVMLHKNSSIPSFTLTSYHAPNTVYEIQETHPVAIKQLPEPVKIVKHTSGTAATDGEKIPYTFVCAVKRPEKLCVVAYGAYGISSSRAYPIRWLPWLKRGYALVEAAPRGGRENGDAWYDAARTALRKRTTFDDIAAVIKTVQARFHYKPENTVIYGRSAGGWSAAYIGQKYANLVGAVYAEVPYLDVLRTTTNPSLPLTQLEYDEFGDPVHRPAEYAALTALSPIDIAESAPASAPTFLVRSALHDSQVLPYESLKYSAKMRSLGWPIFVGMDTNGGHFVETDDMYAQYAQDFLIIESVLESKKRRKTLRRRRGAHARTKLRSQRSRGTCRRRRSSRKH